MGDGLVRCYYVLCRRPDAGKLGAELGAGCGESVSNLVDFGQGGENPSSLKGMAFIKGTT